MDNIYLSGIASGLDWEALISKLMAVERKPILNLQARQKTFQDRSTAWKDINSRLYNLQTKADALKSSNTFYSKKAESSDTSVVGATASTGTSAGTYQVEVVRLAKAHTVMSAGQTSATTALGVSGNPLINGKSVAITESDSLTSIRDKINSTADIGVSASVVQVSSTEFRLVLTAKESGSAKSIVFQDNANALLNLGVLVDDGTVHANTIQEAEDAEIRVNSLTITRSSNTIADVIPGLTLQVRREGQTATVTVSQDIDKAVDAVRAFVEQYNSTIDMIAVKSYYNKDTKSTGVLFGDGTVRQLQLRLKELVFNKVPGASSGLDCAQLVGLSSGAFGTSDANKLLLNESKLRNMLEQDLDAVARLFGATPVNVALASAGASATATDGSGGPNEYAPVSVYGAANVINGSTSSDFWGTVGGGWADNTPGVYPDILEIDFGAARTIDKVKVWTLNSATYPAETYGIRDYTLQYYDGSSWIDLASVTGNTSGLVIHEFEAVTTQKIRLHITATNGSNDYSRVVEVEAFQKNEGIGARLYAELKAYTGSGGMLYQKQKTLEDQARTIGRQIERMQERLALREKSMKKQFRAMELALSRLKNQGKWLSGQIDQLSKNWG